MRPLIILPLIIILFKLAFAESSGLDTIKVVYHLNETDKIHLLISSVTEFRKEHPEASIEVVIHGPAVLRLGNTSSVADKIEELLKQNIRVGACSIAVRKSKLPPGILVNGVETLEQGGVSRIVELQKLGYAYIKI